MKVLFAVTVALLLAGLGPTVFPVVQAGYSSLSVLVPVLVLPAILLLALLGLATRRPLPWLGRDLAGGAAAGVLATVALEVVRLAGYGLGFMPGNLPRLMGVLLLDRFALGPSFASDLAGWAYHIWNGAAFGISYVLLVGTRRRVAGVVFGIAVGVGFLLSPVVRSLGVGVLGLDFSIGFPLTVLLAHTAFGLALGVLAPRFAGGHASRVLDAMRAIVLSTLLGLRVSAGSR